MLKKIALAALAALLAIGCNAPPDEILLHPGSTIALDPAFTAAEHEATVVGADMWQAGLTFNVGGEGWRYRQEAPGDSECVTLEYEIWCAPGVLTAALAAHEFGHALGLEHSKDPDSVMAKRVRRTATVTPADHEAFCKLWPCE